jgi:hypothetical protein
MNKDFYAHNSSYPKVAALWPAEIFVVDGISYTHEIFS